MAYSHSRLRKTLALVRIATGIAFVSLGWYKVASLEFAKFVFPDFLDSALRGGGAGIVQPLLHRILTAGPARIGVGIGFLELFIGVALLLGLAVRPACLAGLVYISIAWLASWNPATGPHLLQTAEYQFRFLFPLLIFLVLGVGHAGETWGVGALYHHHRDRIWASEKLKTSEVPVTPAHEPASFEEYADAEAQEREGALQFDEEERLEDVTADREF